MFPKRRILQSLKHGLTLRSNVHTTALKCDKPDSTKCEENIPAEKKPQESESKEKPEKKPSFFKVSVTAEEQEKAKLNLRALIEKMSIHGAEKEDSGTSKPEIQVTQLSKKEKEPKSRDLKLSENNFDQALFKSLKKVAVEFGGDVKKTEIDLLSSLKAFSVVKEKETSVDTLPGKLEKRSKGASFEAYLQEDLGIFKEKKDYEAEETEIKLKIWDELEAMDLKVLGASPPRNYFEEQIMWTEKGKLWHFPIDNDQGRDDEAAVHFSEHVFLDEHLESWCPKRGPIKKFMDLVLVGLSKNPYLTIQDKKDHIYWYRDYFEGKKKVLEELGAITPVKEISSTKNSESEAEGKA